MRQRIEQDYLLQYNMILDDEKECNLEEWEKLTWKC